MNSIQLEFELRVVLKIIFLLASTQVFGQSPVRTTDINIPLSNTKGIHQSIHTPKTPDPLQWINQWLSPINSFDQAEQLRKSVDREIQQRRSHQSRVQSILEDAASSFSSSMPSIQYEMNGEESPIKTKYFNVFHELRQMLEGQKPLSIKRAVFLSENAYDPSIDWETYSGSIQGMVENIGAFLQQEKVDPKDQLAKTMSLFQFFADTLKIHKPGFERPTITYPLLYDFDDFWGHDDLRNVFVSKLLKTGTGQCHSLPLLFLILAEEINVQAHLAFSPSHSYIKFQDRKGNWHNIELTNQMLTSDQFVMNSGFIKAEALANELYMKPLGKKEVVAQTLNDLAIAYAAQFGYDDFVAACTNLAYQHGLKSMTIHKLNFNYYLAKHQMILNQYRQYGLTREDFEKDEKAMRVYNNLVGAQKHIEKLGYADMPADQYERWLNSVKQEAQKQEHRNKMRTLMGTLGNH